MSKYNNSRQTENKSYKANNFKKKNQTGSNKSFGVNRGYKPQAKKQVKAFNPLMFIKKVEEQTVSAAYQPKNNFSDFLIDDRIKANILNKGYTIPTPIQDQVIPLILQGRDVIATANTGTGKTAAFLIPLVHNVLTKKIDRVLIITPTRELAAQIQTELQSFKFKLDLASVLCIGGLKIDLQMRYLAKNPAFVIGTPGRLIDLEQNGCINFSKYDAIVLDEVDTMLDMGFINDIRNIINKLPKKRHSLFFSATISSNIKSLMDSFLYNPVSISVKTRQSPENVNQTVVKTQNKIEQLHDLLIKPEFTRVIIFLRTKRSVDKLSKNLKERGFIATAIHGDKTQAHRKKALSQFKEDNVKILLATDVMARGIDIDDVSHVINYDMPQTYEDYIHRIGRTGRASKIGQAITFVD